MGTVGIAGLGAIGNAVKNGLDKGINGLNLVGASELNPPPGCTVPLMDFAALADACDLVIECLPPKVVPALAKITLEKGKDLMLISSCALLIYPEILEWHKNSKSRIIVPSGALAGLDGVSALKELGIRSAKISSTKRPMGFSGAPYIEDNQIDLSTITEKTRLFNGNALEAARGFPANVNVAATLSLAGIGPENTQVEIWADPEARGNTHEIEVTGEFSTIRTSIENTPDPANPKSSMLAAQSIIHVLKGLHEPLVVF